MLTLEPRVIIKYEHIVQSLLNMSFWCPFLGAHLYHTPLEHRCPIWISNRIRPTYLKPLVDKVLQKQSQGESLHLQHLHHA